MRWAVISSRDFFGDENPGHVMSARFGILLAALLNPEMDVNARCELLYHYLREDNWTAVKKGRYNAIFEEPTVDLAAKKICKYWGIKSTPRIAKNLADAILALGKMRRAEIKKEIVGLEQQRDRILRREKGLS